MFFSKKDMSTLVYNRRKNTAKQKADNLLKYFKTISKIKNATKEELLQVKGINEQNAQEIVNHFN